MKSTGVIIFVRNPELGKVKSRLAAEVGETVALSIYKKLLNHTHAIARNADADVFIFTTENQVNNLWEGFTIVKQKAGDLGEKMEHAFNFILNKKYRKVIIIGSDCPGLNVEHINSACNLLENFDAVIGPATDGGYYLLALKKMYTKIFIKKNWSTDTVLADTLETLKAACLTFTLLEELTDVDIKNDLPDTWLQEFNIT